MAQFTAKWAQMKSNTGTLTGASLKLTYCNFVLGVSAATVPFSNEINYQIKRVLQSEQQKFSEYSKKVGRFKKALIQSADTYKNTEKNLLGDVSGTDEKWFDIPDDFKELILQIMGEGGIMGGALAAIGYFTTGGKPQGTIKGFKSLFSSVENLADAIEAAKTSGASFDWKRLFGLNTVEAKSFAENAAKYFDDFKFGEGAVKCTKAVAKWAGVALTAILNVFDNLKENNSPGRTAAEITLETALDLGIGSIVSIGTATIAGTVGAPVVVVGGIIVAALWAIDCGFEHFTGKDLVEFVSDSVLNTLEAGGEFVSNATKKVREALGNVASSAGKVVSGWWSKMFA